MSRRAAILLALATALALPAATAAKTNPCAADQRLVNVWHKVLADTVRQTAILQEMLPPHGRQPAGRLRDRRAPLARGEEPHAARGGSRNAPRRPGAEAPRLRFIREVARPLNTCIGKFLVADTPEEFEEVVRASTPARVRGSRSAARSTSRSRRCGRRAAPARSLSRQASNSIPAFLIRRSLSFQSATALFASR